jgi:sporulation protein YlmC with PRC-barrel domain
MGMVEEALLDPAARFVAALRVRGSGIPDGEQLVLHEVVKRIGQHAVILSSEADRGPSRPPDFDQLIDLKAFIGVEVFTDEGTLLGRMHDAQIDPQTLTIIEYELTRTRWDTCLHRWMRVSAQYTLSGSKDVLLIPQAAVPAEDSPLHS